MTNLNELQYFFQVAQSKSFTLAAERLSVPKSSVSRAISRLEERLKVQLINEQLEAFGSPKRAGFTSPTVDESSKKLSRARSR